MHKLACQATLFDGKGTTIIWINKSRLCFLEFIFSWLLLNRTSYLCVIIRCENVKNEPQNAFSCQMFLVYETICLPLHKNE